MRPSTEAVDAAVVRAVKKGIPVVLAIGGRRRTTTSSFVTVGRLGHGPYPWRIGCAEKLNGKGNVVLLAGIAGASPAELRIRGGDGSLQAISRHQGAGHAVHDWSPAKGKTVMAALDPEISARRSTACWADSGLQASGAHRSLVAAGYKPDGEIPPFTCGDLNACWVNAIKHKVPMMSIDNPPAGGGAALETALEVLQGLSVPRQVTSSHADRTVTKGDETPSIKADMPAEDYAKMDAPG